MSIKHLVFNDSSKGLLKAAFGKTESFDSDNILSFSEVLSNGPISNLSSQEGISTRINWLDKYFVIRYDDESLVDYFGRSYSVFDSLSEDDKIILWYGENSVEMLALSYAVSRLQDFELYEMPITELCMEDERYKEKIAYHVAELAPEDISYFAGSEKKLGTDKINNLISTWDRVVLEDKELRILEDGVVLSVDVDFYDQLLLQNCSSEFEKTGPIIGKTMVDSSFNASDTFIENRILTLIDKNILEYQGKLEGFYNYLIKLK